MKLDQQTYDFSKRLGRVLVTDAAVSRTLARIAAADNHLVLRTEDGDEVVSMSREEYEGLMEALDVLSDDEAVKALQAIGKDVKPRRPQPQGQVLTLEGLRAQRDAILGLAAKRGVQNVRIFGSVARGEARPDSDVDFLVELEPRRSLMDLSGLLLDLQDLLGRRVDVAEPDALHWYTKDRILNEAVPL